MSKVFAFGDSFTFGHELSDSLTNHGVTPSRLAYAALVAKELQYDYQCYAVGAYANNAITRRIIETYNSIDSSDIVLVMWTFPERHEFSFDGDLGRRTIQASDEIPFAKEYFRSIDMGKENIISNAIREIYIAQQLLLSRGVRFLFMSAVTDLSCAIKNREVSFNLLNELNDNQWLFFDNNYGFREWARYTLQLSFIGHPPDSAHKELSRMIISRLNG